MAEPKVDIYMRLYVGDYLADTRELSAEEHGAYLLLIMAAWTRDGRLPFDSVRLSRLAAVPLRRWPKVWGMIAKFFEMDGQGWIVQPRVLREIERAKAIQKQASEAGKKSALSRSSAVHKLSPNGDENEPANPIFGEPDKPVNEPKLLDANPTVVQPPLTSPLQREGNILDPKPESEPEKRETSGSGGSPPAPWPGPPSPNYRPSSRVYLAAITPAFLSVYEAYPNPGNKTRASQVFAELAEGFSGGEAALAAAILDAFRRGFLKRHPYDSENLRFVPLLESVLAERRWEEPFPEVRNSSLGGGLSESEYPE